MHHENIKLMLNDINIQQLTEDTDMSNCKETEIFFGSKESYAIATKILKGRFDQSVTIPGTLQYHALISTQDRKLLMKKIPSSEEYDIFPKGRKNEPQKRPAKLPPKAKKIAKKHNSTK